MIKRKEGLNNMSVTGTAAGILLALSALLFSGCGGGSESSGDGPAGGFDQAFTDLQQQASDSISAIATAADGSGDIYVGGGLKTYHTTSSTSLVRLNRDGSVDLEFATGSGFAMGGSQPVVTVLTPAADSSGDIYVGGLFSAYNGTSINNIARMNSDGTLDSSFSVGSGFNGAVRAITLAPDGSGDILVGGDFTSYNSTASNRIIRLRMDGSIVGTFNAGSGFNASVYSIAAVPGASGDVYVGGRFINYNTTTTGRIVRLNSDGSVDASFATGTGFDGTVRTIAPAIDGSDYLYVGGEFHSYNGTSSIRIIRLIGDGSVDSSFASGSGFSNTDLIFSAIVLTIAPATDVSGAVYVGGYFDTYNGTASSHLTRLNSDGSKSNNFVMGTGFNLTVNALVTPPGGAGDVYVGGHFTTYNGSPSNRLTHLNADGSKRNGFAQGGGFDHFVRSIAPAIDDSNDIYIAGDFTTYKGAESPRIIRLNNDGTRDKAFSAGTGFDFRVHVVAPALDGSGDVYAGGRFLNYNGTSSNRIIRLNSDGSVDAGFETGSGFNSDVYAIAPAADGTVYVGGAFANYDGTTINSLVRLNSDGTIDNTFATGTGFNGDVFSIATDSAGDVYAAGSFTEYNGTTHSRIIRLNSDGSPDTGFNTGSGFNSSALAMTLSTDGSGDIYIGGYFTNFNSLSRHRIIRLNSDGSVDDGFFTGIGSNRAVHALAIAQDGSGDIYLGGNMISYNGTTSKHIIRLNSDGSVDSEFVTGNGFNSEHVGVVYTLAVATEGYGDIYVGGEFTSYDTTSASYIIALNPDGSVD